MTNIAGELQAELSMLVPLDHEKLRLLRNLIISGVPQQPFKGSVFNCVFTDRERN